MNGRDMFEIEVAGNVAKIVMRRAPVNAISQEWLQGFGAHLDDLGQRDDWKVLHIRSSQRVFCAGADLNQVRRRLDDPDGARLLAEDTRGFQTLFARIEALPQVTLAEINGAAMGGGFELALSCDLRIAAREARIGLPEVGLGLLPGAGGTQRLTWLCGRGVAKRIILAAEVLDGGEALDLGLVQWAVPAAELAERAGALAARIAALPAKALAACKSCIADAEDNGRDGFGNELESTARMFSNPETRSRVSAFLDQRRAG